MAQTGYTPILIYSSSTGGNAPAAGNLTNSTLGSELAINITDGKLFYKDNANAVQVIGWKTTPTTAGGTGLTSYTAGDLLYYASGTTLSKLAIGTSGQWLGSSGTAPQWNSPAALTKTDDTNVTLTLGGSASTALLNAASLTLGWTGQLATTRGGTGLSSFTANGILYASSTSALATTSDFTYTGSYATLGSAKQFRFYRGDNAIYTELYFTTGASGGFVINNVNGNQNSFQLGGVTQWEIPDANGNLVQKVAAKGINFTANSAAAGMTSQLLNWYEEGSWTPTVKGSTTAGTYQIGTNGCTYTRIGRQVTLNVYIQMAGTVTGGGSGDLQITGVPYAKAANANPVAAVYLALGTFTGNAPTASWNSFSSSSILILNQVASGGYGTAIPISYASANAYIAFTMVYFV